MWAHYAGGFSGIAFEYNLDESKYVIKKIHYDGVPSITVDDMIKIIEGTKAPYDFVKKKWGQTLIIDYNHKGMTCSLLYAFPFSRTKRKSPS